MARMPIAVSVVLPRLLVVLHDLVMVVVAWIGLRWLASMAGAPPAPSLVLELGIAIGVQGLVLRLSGLYRGLWRFASLPDLANLVRAALIGVLLIVALLFLAGLLPDVPRRVLFPYPVALVVMLGMPRVLYRLWKDFRQSGNNADAQRVLVLGAGRTAETLLRDLRTDGRYQPVGLLDDQRALKGAKIQGVPVLVVTGTLLWLQKRGSRVRLPGTVRAAPEDFGREFLDMIIAAKLVDGVDGAIAHIRHYGSNHTESILTENDATAARFFQRLDSAILMRNASTQFADGGEFGMGGEIGIATGKMHARGPVGAEQLTSFKYLVTGDGAIRS